MLLALVLTLPAQAADFQDKPGGELISVQRTFKVSADECKKTWQTFAESDSSFCAVNVQNSPDMSADPTILDSDYIEFKCSPKEQTASKSVALELFPHGTFGYIVMAQGQVSFASIEQCLGDKIRSLPNSEISVTFVKVRGK